MLWINRRTSQYCDQAAIIPIQQLRLVAIGLYETQNTGLAFQGVIEDIVRVEETLSEGGNVREDCIMVRDD